MANELNDVQQLINKKADEKLKQQLNTLQHPLYTGELYKLLQGIYINVGTSEKPKNIALYTIFNAEGFEAIIIENNTQRYREEESKLFLNKVNSLREDVDNLLKQEF